MIRGKDDGIVEAVLDGAPLVSLADVALTILDSCDRDVNVFVAVGLMVGGAVVGAVVAGSLVDAVSADLLTALEGASVCEGLKVGDDSAAEIEALSVAALVAAVPLTVFEASLAVLLPEGASLAVSLPDGVITVAVPVLVPVLVPVFVGAVVLAAVSVGPCVPVSVLVALLIPVSVLVGPLVSVSVFVFVGPCVPVFVLVGLWVSVFAVFVLVGP